MNAQELQAWFALLGAAMALGETVYDGVKHIAKKELTPEELKALEAAWDDDVQRSARNAGITPEPDTPVGG